MKAVKIKDLSFSYESQGNNPADKTVYALDKINLELDAGKKIAFLGANGSGKTTLFYHLNGLNLPQSGELEVLGLKVSKGIRKELRKKVGMVFENPDNQLISTTVYDDVAFGLRNYRWSEERIKEKVHAVLGKVQAEELVDSSPYNLSWGQKKRVAIAGVLAMEPELLVLDEPFSGLDPRVTKSLLALLDWLNSEGKTVIISAHDVDLAYSWADEVVIMSKGSIVNHGTPDVLHDQQEMEEASLDTPILAKVFQTSPFWPQNTAEARSVVERLLEGQS